MSKIKFNEGEGIEFIFENLHFDGIGDVDSEKLQFFGDIKTLGINIRFAPPGQDQHKVDLIPDLRVERVYADFSDENMGFELYGQNTNSPGIKSHIKEWVRNSIDTHAYKLREAFAILHAQIADMFTAIIDVDNFKGRIRLSKLHFFENYADIGVKFMFPKDPDSDIISKTGIFKDQHTSSQEGIEVILDENVVNTILYAAYNINSKLSIRDDLWFLFKDFSKIHEYLSVSIKLLLIFRQ